MLWLIVYLTGVSVFAYSCLYFGLPGFFKQTIPLTSSKAISGGQAKIIASLFVVLGIMTGSYVIYGTVMIFRFKLWTMFAS